MSHIRIQIIQKSTLKGNTWDGGETFEYCIYPSTSSYAARNFQWRISSATIVKSPSVFTQFPHYNRYLVMLDNDLQIKRNGQLESYQPLTVFQFQSDDYIQSYSLGQDYNLMVHSSIPSHATFIVTSAESKEPFIVLFAPQSSIVLIQHQEYSLSSLDLILIQNPEHESIQVKSDQTLIMSTLSL